MPSTGTFITSSFQMAGSKVAVIAPLAVAAGAASIIFSTCFWSASGVAGVNIVLIMASRALRPSGPLIADGWSGSVAFGGT